MDVADEARASFLRYRDTGDPEALARVFDLCSQGLLLVAHHVARRGLVAEDLVQSTFLEAMRSARNYDATRPLMPWLCGILSTTARAHARAANRRPDPERLSEQPALDPVDAVLADEFTKVLVQAIQTLPPRQRDVLNLRLVHGLTPTEIAHALGHPVGSVKSWLHRGLERLKRTLPASFTAALALIVGAEQTLAAIRAQVLERAVELGLPPAGPPLESDPTAGVGAPPAVVKSVWKPGLYWLGALALVVGATLFLADMSSAPRNGLAAATSTQATGTALEAAAEPASAPRVAERASASSAVTGTSNLQLRAYFTRDGAPASIALKITPRFGVDPEFRAQFVRTDARGELRIDGLGFGAYELLPDRGPPQAIVVDADTAEVRIAIAPGRRVRGRVHDPTGAAVAGARIWLTAHADPSAGAFAAFCDGTGAFELRDVPDERAFAAIADGFAPGRLQPVGAADDTVEARALELKPMSTTLAGAVSDADRAVLPGARILLGPTFPASWSAHDCARHGGLPPQLLIADALGAFEFRSVPAAPKLELLARASGHPARKLALERGTSSCAIVLERGGKWVGSIDAGDEGPREARVWIEQLESREREPGVAPAWSRPFAHVAAEGRFALDGFGPSRQVLRAIDASQRWDARILEPADASGTDLLEWSPRLGAGHTLRGRALAESGLELLGWRLSASGAVGTARTQPLGHDGSFAIDGLMMQPYTLRLMPPSNGYPGPLAQRARVLPDGNEVEIVLSAAREPSATLTARLLGDDDQVVPRLCVIAASDQADVEGVADADGRVRFGPLPPGDYYLAVWGKMGTTFLSGPWTLAAGAHLDCGDLRARAVGRVRVRGPELPGGRPLTVRLFTLDGRIFVTVFHLVRGGGTSLPVPPGTYRCELEWMNLGWSIAQEIVEVRPGEVGEVQFQPTPGYAVRFACCAPDAAPRDMLTVELRRPADGRTWCTQTRTTLDVSCPPLQFDLEPGHYELTCTSETTKRGTASFEVVADVPTPQIQFELR